MVVPKGENSTPGNSPPQDWPVIQELAEALYSLIQDTFPKLVSATFFFENGSKMGVVSQISLRTLWPSAPLSKVNLNCVSRNEDLTGQHVGKHIS